eukprot:COSAG06_NODE_7852_length_2352_cov_296.342654_2_plen_171_part_00
MLVSRACLGKIVLMACPEPVLERKAISAPKRHSPFFSRFWIKATRRKLTLPAFETKCFGQQNPAKKDKKRQGAVRTHLCAPPAPASHKCLCKRSCRTYRCFLVCLICKDLDHCQVKHLNYLGAGAHRNVAAVPRDSRILCRQKNEKTPPRQHALFIYINIQHNNIQNIIH